MKKNLAFITLVALVVMLVGCPQSITPTTPVVNSGKVIVQGNLYDDNSAKTEVDSKSVNLNNVVDNFISRSETMVFHFYPRKGGNEMTFPVAVNGNGDYCGEFMLPAGQYYVCSNITDGFKRDLFYASVQEVEVVANQISEINMIFSLAYYFNFNFSVSGLPGDFTGYGTARIIADGTVYEGNYYRYYDGRGKSTANDDLVFQFSLPVGFDASENGAYLLVDDANGVVRASMLDFNVFYTVAYPFYIGYVAPTDLGTLDIGVGFTHYPEGGLG